LPVSLTTKPDEEFDMKRLAWVSTIVGLLAQLLVSTANAIPMTASFDGVVTGSASIFPKVLESFPIGTHIAFNVNYDENFGDSTNPTSYYTESTTGWMELGSLRYEFDRDVQGWTYWSSITGYRTSLSFYGTGPTIADGGNLFGLFLSFELSDFTAAHTPIIGFGFPTNGGGTSFSYLSTAGTFTNVPTSVPEPGTLMLSLLGLFGFALRTRRASVA
jgi:hypothetical protein